MAASMRAAASDSPVASMNPATDATETRIGASADMNRPWVRNKPSNRPANACSSAEPANATGTSPTEIMRCPFDSKKPRRGHPPSSAARLVRLATQGVDQLLGRHRLRRVAQQRQEIRDIFVIQLDWGRHQDAPEGRPNKSARRAPPARLYSNLPPRDQWSSVRIRVRVGKRRGREYNLTATRP